jgi:hypothetical protein
MVTRAGSVPERTQSARWQAPQEGAKPEKTKKNSHDHGSPIPVTPGHQHAPACMPCEACKIFKSCVLLPSPACRAHPRAGRPCAQTTTSNGWACRMCSFASFHPGTWLPTRPPLFSSSSRCLVGGFTWGLFVRFQDIEMGTMPSRGPPGSARTTRVSLPVCGHQSTPGFPGCCKPANGCRHLVRRLMSPHPPPPPPADHLHTHSD